jgi:hypothetical protein
LFGERRGIFVAVVAQSGTTTDCWRETDGALKCAATNSRAKSKTPA